MDNVTLNYFDIAWFSSKDGPGTRTVLYLQGCHLRCPWCHSPQSWDEVSSLLFFEDRCLLCGACVAACPNGAHTIRQQKHEIDRALCKRCGLCIKNCPVSRGARWNTGALGLSGMKTDTATLFKILLPQLELLKSIGGLTVSGGEPLLQYAALAGLLSRCKGKGIHITVETSASVPRKNIEAMYELVDQWLIGIRPVSCTAKEWQPFGDWSLITENLEFLTAYRTDNIVIRYPVIPGYTDNAESARKTGEIMKQYKISALEILPYNRMADHYYRAMGIPFALNNIVSEKKVDLTPYRDYFATGKATSSGGGC